MSDKEPQVTFTDRRKISSDGEIRPEAAAEQEANRREMEQRDAAKKAATPAPNATSASAPKIELVPDTKASEQTDSSAATQDESLPDGPTAQETAESHAAYQQTTKQLDELLRATRL